MRLHLSFGHKKIALLDKNVENLYKKTDVEENISFFYLKG